MKRRFLLQTTFACILLLGIAMYVGSILRLVDGPVWGSADISQLRPSTEDYLKNLPGRLKITYFATTEGRLPSHLKETARQVQRLLAAMQDVIPGQIDFRVIDPDASNLNGIAYASSQRVSSFSVRKVLHDEHSEQNIWSSLVLTTSGQPEILIQRIQPEHLPYLEGLIIERLKGQQSPPRPVFAVSIQGSYRFLPALLNEYGTVIEVDLKNENKIPHEADVLFWIQPQKVTPEHVTNLKHFIKSGRSVVLAGSSYDINYSWSNKTITYYPQLFSNSWQDILRPFGLQPVPDLVMDNNFGNVPLRINGEIRQIEAPFHLRLLPAFYDMKGFHLPARGGLNFVAPSPIKIDPLASEESGFRARPMGTTTEHVRVLSLPAEPFTESDLVGSYPVPKQNLIVQLKPKNNWHGELLVLASASPFRDELINQNGYAHRIFLNNLARTYGDPERIIRARIDKQPPSRLVLPSNNERLLWRVLVIFVVPSFVLGIAIYRYKLWQQWTIQRLSQSKILIMVLIAASLIGIGNWISSSPRRLFADFTNDKLNTPNQTVRKLLLQNSKKINARLFISPRAIMPGPLKKNESRIIHLLNLGEVTTDILRPNNFSDSQLSTLALENISPFAEEITQHDTLSIQPIWSSLSLRNAERKVNIPRLDSRTMLHLEFLLAAGLQQLSKSHKPRIAIISDLPRLSPAEALEDYQKKGLIAPGGADVYSELKALLNNYLYDVLHVNPKNPVLPVNTDILVWLQPRRDSKRVIELLSRHLASGGKALVALQHFNIQQRQYRGNGFQTVYWPQPQFQDLNRFTELFGIKQVREILFDQTQSHLDLDTQINRSAIREYDPQKVALPFLIRSVGSNYSQERPETRYLGDLLFIWGNRFSIDKQKLASLGIKAETLISTSNRSWSFDWKGGWLPLEVLTPQKEHLPGKQALAMSFHGRFDPVSLSENDEGRTQISFDGEAQNEGTLMLIGSSEMFKNKYLYADGFQHDQFILNTIANMAYGTELGKLQARRPTARGFAFQSSSSKQIWRIIVVGLCPSVFITFGFLRLRSFSRKSS
ncbi:MAG: Gldg family protein [Candidatus Latescibacterota bacterium]|nr:Gldg family protein [Candidatus Latescibacterota bacterium]